MNKSMILRADEAFRAVQRGAVTCVTVADAAHMLENVYSTEFIANSAQLTLERIEADVEDRRWNWMQSKTRPSLGVAM